MEYVRRRRSPSVVVLYNPRSGEKLIRTAATVEDFELLRSEGWRVISVVERWRRRTYGR